MYPSTKYLLILLSLVKIAYGQDNGKNISLEKNLAVGINYGSLATGIEVSTKPLNKFGFRFGYNQGNFKGAYYTSFSGENIFVEGKVGISLLHFFCDYYPVNGSTFRVTAGLGYNKNKYYTKLSPVNAQKFGLIVFSPSELGYIELQAKGNILSPYVGIGFGNNIPKYKLGLGFDVGIFYQGQPKFTVIGNGSFEPSGTSENEAVLEEAFRDFSIYPFFTLSLKYRIIK